MPSLSIQELKEIGTTSTRYSQITQNSDKNLIRYRDKLQKKRIKKPSELDLEALDNLTQKASKLNSKQERVLKFRLFPDILLARYLILPLWHSLTELLTGKRVAINLFKIITSVVLITAIVTALIYFPPLSAFLVASSLPVSIATISGLASLALLIGNGVTSFIEKISHKRHWSPYECTRLQEKDWQKHYGINKDISQKMRAYLFNKSETSKNDVLKKITLTLLNDLERGDQSSVNDLTVFFVKELDFLENTSQDYTWVLEIVNALNEAHSLAEPTRKVLAEYYRKTSVKEWQAKMDERFIRLNSLIARGAPDNQSAILTSYQDLKSELEKLKVKPIDKETVKINLIEDSHKVLFKGKDYMMLHQYIERLNKETQKIKTLLEPSNQASQDKLEKLNQYLTPYLNSK